MHVRCQPSRWATQLGRPHFSPRLYEFFHREVIGVYEHVQAYDMLLDVEKARMVARVITR